MWRFCGLCRIASPSRGAIRTGGGAHLSGSHARPSRPFCCPRCGGAHEPPRNEASEFLYRRSTEIRNNITLRLSRATSPDLYVSRQGTELLRSGTVPGELHLPLGGYLALYKNVSDQIAIGEGTASYLWSQTAARNIAERLPHARIIINLRNPVDRAYSQYLKMLTDGVTRKSFRGEIARVCVASTPNSACGGRFWSWANTMRRSGDS